ncbi:MAG: 16S rRNA (guanine(527)-N(7))-methyltransferase RsmG [Campylobacteraceae bacterium]|nr:16S rRNA (guanine(527)-N(7))-methyltransferase RsmG [Campylobacteraceae bacterium]
MDKSISTKLNIYADLLLSYNRVHNISGVKSLKEVNTNIEDSLAPLSWVGSLGKVCIDVGSGAGFPALPLAISSPDVEFHLFEPIAKKSSFLHLVKVELGLSGVHIHTSRIEDFTPFFADTITSRAVTNVSALVALVRPFIGSSTQLLLYKGSHAHEETKGFKNVDIVTKGDRRYVVIKDIL